MLILRAIQLVTVLMAFTAVSEPASGKTPHKDKATDRGAESTGGARLVLWREPLDLESRDLFYGTGGRQHACGWRINNFTQTGPE